MPSPWQLDVRWLADATPLMSADYWGAHGAQPAEPRMLDAVAELGAEPAPRQVGRWFERVHLAALQSTDGVEVLASNRALCGGGRTLGELDVLYRAAERVVHREVAVKYYLAVGDGDDPSCWIGPGKRDRLDRKLDRLVTHQLALSELARAQDAWPDDLPVPDRVEVLLLGALFSPPESPRLPHGAEAAAEHGRWYFASDFADRFGEAPWVELEKPWWLSPQHARGFAAQPATGLAALVAQRKRPMFVARPSGERAFVVHEGW